MQEDLEIRYNAIFISQKQTQIQVQKIETMLSVQFLDSVMDESNEIILQCEYPHLLNMSDYCLTHDWRHGKKVFRIEKNNIYF